MLIRYFRRHPSLPVVVRTFLGVKENDTTPDHCVTDEEFAELTAKMEKAFGGLG